MHRRETGSKRRVTISVRWLMLGVSALILLFPILALLGLKIYQNHLVRQTELSLIGQAVLIGEAWRGSWLQETGQASDADFEIRPLSRKSGKYVPINPLTNLSEDLLPPIPDPTRYADNQTGPKARAGERIGPLLERAKIFNLSSARVLDEKGCAVASSGAWLGACFDDLHEVRGALDGRYTAVARQRISDQPPPSFSSISRRGDVRVFVALPVFSDGDVIAAVWMSRTSMAPLKAAWLNRRPLLAGLIASVVLTAIVSLFLAGAITRPIRQITEAAESVARGDASRNLAPKGIAFAEIHNLGAALATMTDQLSDRAEYIADFAANVTHELKSPITAIRGAAELLREEWEEMPEPQRGRFLENIEADAARMERLVTRLLELARIQSAPETSAPVALQEILNRVTEAYDEEVTVKMEEGAPTIIYINPDHLESALRNLTDNAVRHGGGEPIDIIVSAAGERCAISVRDKGKGISPANQRRLFDRFFTTERDRGGTGLGLAIVRAVAETRGGSITVETGPTGSAFTLTV